MKYGILLFAAVLLVACATREEAQMNLFMELDTQGAPVAVDQNTFGVSFSTPYSNTGHSIYIRINEITTSQKVSFFLLTEGGEQQAVERAAIGTEWKISDTASLRLTKVDPPARTAYFSIVE